MAGRWLLARVGFEPALRRVRDILALVFLAAALSTMISATVGVLSLVALESVDLDAAPRLWRTWWLGDMGGDLVVAPALMIAATHLRLERPPGTAVEAVALVLAVGAASALVFTSEAELSYLLFPLLVWAALRFWQPGAAGAGLIVGAIAVTLTASGEGPWAMNDPDERLLLAQTYTGVAVVSALLLASVTTLRYRAEAAVAEIASTLQDGLLPPRLPDLPGIETATLFRAAAAHQHVGGDFYDVFPTGDGTWAVTVGDVRGKGSHAAATTALARHTLRAGALQESRPRDILRLLNRAMLLEHGGRDFCTTALAAIEIADDSATIVLTLAGHPRPLLLRASGEVEEVGRPGLLLGLDPGLEPEEMTARLAPADALVLYTDGLTDAFAPERVITPARLRSLLAGAAGAPASEIVGTLERALLESDGAAPRDDIAVLVVRFTGSAA